MNSFIHSEKKKEKKKRESKGGRRFFISSILISSPRNIWNSTQGIPQFPIFFNRLSITSPHLTWVTVLFGFREREREDRISDSDRRKTSFWKLCGGRSILELINIELFLLLACDQFNVVVVVFFCNVSSQFVLVTFPIFSSFSSFSSQFGGIHRTCRYQVWHTRRGRHQIRRRGTLISFLSESFILNELELEFLYSSSYVGNVFQDKIIIIGISVVKLQVADIRKMNGLVTDRQMFGLRFLQIPLPGRHPPSPCLSNASG